VVADVVVMLADGGESIVDVDVLRHKASSAARARSEVSPAWMRTIQAARARLCRHLWAQMPGEVPASTQDTRPTWAR
jgi:hypothetical protein